MFTLCMAARVFVICLFEKEASTSILLASESMHSACRHVLNVMQCDRDTCSMRCQRHGPRNALCFSCRFVSSIFVANVVLDPWACYFAYVLWTHCGLRHQA